MPELPEVEALALDLRGRFADRAIAKVHVVAFSALKTFDPPVTALEGSFVDDVTRHGKFLDISAGGLHLVFHLARAGWIRWRDELPPVPPRPSSKSPLAVRVILDDDTGVDVTEAGTKKSLAAYVVRQPSDVPGIASLGPDPLADSFDVETLGAILQRAGRSQVKGVLRHQGTIAGIGNAYSDEVLHAATASPAASTCRARASGPPLVVLGGSEGGTPDRFARLFAEAGHVTLALAYFGERGLPEELNRGAARVLARGLRWLRDRPEYVGRVRRLLWGASRGGEAALLVASYFPELVSGTVAASPADVVVCSFPPSKHSAWTLDGRELPCTRRRNLGREPIPVEQITTPVLLICGERDRVWAACAMSRRVAARLVVPHQLLVYPEAGHFAAFEDEALEKTLDFLAAPSG